MKLRLFTLLVSLLFLAVAHATVPEAISYQGRALTTTGGLMGAGTPVTRTITFRIWDHPSNSLVTNLMYSEQQLVTIAEGEFSVLVGTGQASAGTPLGYSEAPKGPPTVKISDAFGGPSRYLGVTIGNGTAAVAREIFPRQQMVSAAYAFRSKVTENLGSDITTAMIAEGAVTTDSIADNAITAAKIGDGTIATASLAAGSVTTATIADGSISLAKLGGSIPVGMVRIPGGTFTMGNSVRADTDITFASPVSTTISEFWLGIHTVTYSEWLAVYHWATDHGYSFTNAGSGKFPNHPVQTVSWNDTVKWCNARSEKEGLTPVYYTDTAQTGIYRGGDETLTNQMVKWAANGYRLPTEAEWERAARGGLDGQRFPWGDVHISHKLANYKTSSNGSMEVAWDLGPSTTAAAIGYHVLGSVGGTKPATSAVGSFAPNGYGLYDMAGNVFQHCWDWLGTAVAFEGSNYAGGVDPRGSSIQNATVTRYSLGGSWSDGTLSGGPYRVKRGGSWGTPGLRSELERLAQSSRDSRTAQRSISTTPQSVATNTGFRVARSGLSDGADSSLLALAAPVFSPMGGEHADPLIVTITSPDGASIIYTTDGSDPLKYNDHNGSNNATTAASPAQVPFSTSGNVTLRARAIQSTRISLPTSATYELSRSLEEVVIARVTVGDAGNASDPVTGLGAVDYEYKIAKNETTISDYATFLNAVARTDTYALYSTDMIENAINGISRSGIPGAYTYSVNSGSGNKPITYVDWFGAARFANWMHNGQPLGAQNASSTEDGAYPLGGKTSGIVAKNSGANVWIPSDNEWYKAAYYDPDKSEAGVGGYWLHANQSDAMTSNTIGVAGASNHEDADGYAVWAGGTSWGITNVGAYGLNSESAYGTNDQAGNVSEWTDGVVGGTSRPLRGGGWLGDDSALLASDSFSIVPAFRTVFAGFRVATTTKNYDAIAGRIPLIAPVFSPIGGEHFSPLTVTITSPDGADIIYTTDGSDTLLSGNSKATQVASPVSVPLSVLGETTLRAHTVGTTTVSPQVSAVYQLSERPPAAPVFSPTGGDYPSPLTVTITSPDGAGLIYTTDGSDPLLSGNSKATEATSPASVPLSVLGATTLRAHAVGATTVSPQVSAVYNLFEVPPAAPVFSPTGGEHFSPLTVTITSPDGADLVYTTDGSEPLLTDNSMATEATSPASVPLSVLGATMLRAHAVGATTVSPQVTAVYELYEAGEEMAQIPVGSFTMGDSLDGYAPLSPFPQSQPARSFTMGDSLDGDTDAPPITVNVSEFFIGKNEVTKGLWDEVRTWGLANGYTDLAVGAGNATHHPAQTISWWDVVKWCNARSQKEGLNPVYTVSNAVMKSGTVAPVANLSANGYRLPTEAEWEKAARGGVNGKRYPWGTDTISHSEANYRASSDFSYDLSGAVNNFHPKYATDDFLYTSRVGSFAANGYGLYDMAGNVGEWCWDMYGASTYVNGATDPRGAALSTTQVLRGGSWLLDASDCGAAKRAKAGPSGAYVFIGFRVARSSAERPPVTPVLSPMGGEHPSPLMVTITSPDGVGLTYTTDGSDPLLPDNSMATEATSPASVQLSVLGATTLRAHAVWATQVSPEASENYMLYVELEKIPAGSFTMGRTSGDTDVDAPSVTVNVSEFFIGINEVTKGLWDEVQTWGLANGYTDLAVGAGRASNHPAQTISWWDAVKWCNARSQKEGLNPVYTVSSAVMKTGTTVPTADWSANGYRLPTEAEWEKAARGGVNGKRFPWGTDLISHSEANYNASFGGGYDRSNNVQFHPTYKIDGYPWSAPVGSFAANGYGLNDMAGNVIEWCWDRYGASTYSSGNTDPRGAASGADRVTRGGGWFIYAITCRAAHRMKSQPATSHSYLGFRVARSSAP